MSALPHALRLALCAPLLAVLVHAESAAPADSAPPARRERALSPRLASVLAATLPKYEAPTPGGATAGANRATRTDQPQNDIIRLPDYIVREHRLPTPEDLLTAKGWEADASRRYLGPKGNLDRTLNAVTLAELWQSIPVLGRIPFVPFNSLNDGQRAQLIDGRVEAKRRWAELLDVEGTAQKLEKEKVPPAPPPRH